MLRKEPFIYVPTFFCRRKNSYVESFFKHFTLVIIERSLYSMVKAIYRYIIYYVYVLNLYSTLLEAMNKNDHGTVVTMLPA